MVYKQIILVALLVVILFPVPVNAQFSKTLFIQENSGTDLTDYQVLINLSGVNFPLEANASGSDIRFADEYGYILDYWIEEYNYSAKNAGIWVKVPLIPANGTAVLVMYWGNSSAVSFSNATRTFVRELEGVIESLPFDEGSGSVARDTSGNGLDGTVSGSAWVYGRSSSALQFDGVDDYVQVSNTGSVFNLVSSWTLEAWVRPSSPGWDVRNDPIIWKIANNGWNEDTFYLAWGPGNTFNCGLERAWDDLDFIATSSPHSPGQWYHVVGMYNGSYLRIYVDGTLEGSVYISSIAAYTGPAPLRIGNILHSDHGNRGVFDGIVDEIRIYDRGLTSGEVLDLYNNCGFTTVNYPRKTLVRKCAPIEPSVMIPVPPAPQLCSFFDNFSTDSGAWSYIGSAYRDPANGYVVLTQNGAGQAGIIWFNSSVSLNFTAEFRYWAGGGSGADGFVFMFLKNRDYIPGNGGSLGFIGPSGDPVPSYGIEFDGWLNSDPSSNHIALIKDHPSTHLVYVNDLRTEDSLWHNVMVVVNGSGVSVALDNVTILTWAGELNRTFEGLGFSGATGDFVNWHVIDDFRIIMCEPVPSPEPEFEFSVSGNQTTSVGGNASYSILLHNPNAYPINLDLGVSGLDPIWYSLERLSVFLVAGETAIVYLDVSVPGDCGNAGTYYFSISAGSRSASASLTVESMSTISDLTPPNSSILSSDDVLFSWRSSVNSSTELFIRKDSDVNYTLFAGDSGVDHIITVSNLSRNTDYVWYVRSCSTCGCSASPIQRFYVDNGIVFTQNEYFFNVERDYNQYVSVSVRNLDSVSHTLLVQVMNPYDDLIVGFVGNGSLDHNLTLGPGETADMNFMVHAQDVMSDHYMLLVNLTNLAENITDYALIHVYVRRPNINFTLIEVVTNPVTLSKTYRIVNYGDSITDLRVYADDNLSADLIFYPAINHGNLQSRQSIVFEAVPVLSENFTGIAGKIMVQGMDSVVSEDANFTLPPGKQVFLGRVYNPRLCVDVEDWYCTNRPNIDIPFNIPSGYTVDESSGATIRMYFDLNYDNWYVKPHNVYLGVNGNPVGSILNRVPYESYLFSFDPGLLHYSDTGVGRNVINLRSTHPLGHYIVYTGVRACTCLDEYTGYVVATSPEEANELLWHLSFLEKSSSLLDIELLSPSAGDELVAGRSTMVRARVIDDGSGGNYPVNVSFAGGDVVWLFDDGRHGDEVAGDGVYTNYVTPPFARNSSLSLYSDNCVTSASFELDFNITLLPDLAVSSAGITFSNPAPAVNETVTVYAKVHNIGYENASDVRIQLSADSVLLSDEVIGFIAAGGNILVSANWTSTLGDHVFSVSVDPLNIIPEVYEINNFASKTLSVGGGGGTGNETPGDMPDLAVYGHEILFTKTGGGG